MAFEFYEAVYIDAAWVKANTSNSEIKNLSDEIINTLIIKSQVIIDNYIWDIEKYEDTQDFKFPSVDSHPDIPTNITMATLYLVENIFEYYKWEYWKQISVESWEWYSKHFKDWNELQNVELLNWTIRNLLSEYWINEDNLDRKAFLYLVPKSRKLLEYIHQ